MQLVSGSFLVLCLVFRGIRWLWRLIDGSLQPGRPTKPAVFQLLLGGDA